MCGLTLVLEVENQEVESAVCFICPMSCRLIDDVTFLDTTITNKLCEVLYRLFPPLDISIV